MRKPACFKAQGDTWHGGILIMDVIYKPPYSSLDAVGAKKTLDLSTFCLLHGRLITENDTITDDANTSYTLYTVPAGKVFLLLSAMQSARAYDNDDSTYWLNICPAGVTLGGQTKTIMRMALSRRDTTVDIGTQMAATINPVIPLLMGAGDFVQAYENGATLFTYCATIVGYEIDAAVFYKFISELAF